MVFHSGRAIAPHNPRSIAENYQADRITKLRDALHSLWVEKCVFGKKISFYNEAEKKARLIGKAGGHPYSELMGDIETVAGFNHDLPREAKKVCYEAYERVLVTLLSEETVERHHIHRALSRARYPVKVCA